MTDQEYNRISTLVSKYVMSALTLEQEQELHAWRTESKENEGLFKELCNSEKTINRLDTYIDFDLDEAFERFNHKHQLFKQTKIRRINWAQVASYAAMFIGVLFVAVYLLRDISQSDLMFVDETSVKPGSSKAVLMVGGSMVYELDEDQDSILKLNAHLRVQNKHALLSYQIDKQPESGLEMEWHKLVVPRGGEYKLVLADGTKVWLNAGSELEFTDMFLGQERIVRLQGEAYFDVSKDEKHPFIVETKDMHVKVYGTGFNVKAYASEIGTHTTLVEGSVGVDLRKDDEIIQTLMLKPDMQVTYNRGQPVAEIKSVKAKQYVGWKDGLFQFNDESLESVLRQLGRWYNVDVRYYNDAARQIRFSGEMKRMSELQHLLELLELGSEISLSVSHSTIEVR